MAEEVDPKYTETIIGMSIEEHEKKLAEERAKKAHRRKWSTTLAFLTVFFGSSTFQVEFIEFLTI